MVDRKPDSTSLQIRLWVRYRSGEVGRQRPAEPVEQTHPVQTPLGRLDSAERGKEDTRPIEGIVS